MKRIVLSLTLLAVTIVAMAQEAPKSFEIKSGIAKINTTLMGQVAESTTYFDNYGAISVTKSKTSVPGSGEIEVSTITKDGKNYIVIPAMKQVREAPVNVEEVINYLQLTDEVREKFKIKELGTETVCGKECTKYSEEITQQGQKASATVCVWKGFPMKTIIAFAGLEITTEVVEFTEDAFILPQTFEIPSFE